MTSILIPCPDKESAKIEWDKFYLREVIESIEPTYNPVNFMVQTEKQVNEALTYFEDRYIKIALKPRNLTGGKGVKVQGRHFDTYKEAREYALQVLSAPDQAGIEIQEKLEGHEFTLQFFTDGTTLILPPASYDYPYREDGDEGPGTGGMGAFTMCGTKDLPFVTTKDYSDAVLLMRKLLVDLKKRRHDYKGILYPTFFKTRSGLKLVEVNARGGDPELINILDLMDDNVDFGDVLVQIAEGRLTEKCVTYKEKASAMLYLVSPDYGYRNGPSYEFNMNIKAVESFGCNIRFAAAEHISGNRFRTVGSSRTVGISSIGDTPWEARKNIHVALQAGFKHPLPLEYRKEIADKKYINRLKI